MRLIVCGCEKMHMEYLLDALGLIAKRDRRHLTVTAPDALERNDDMCRYITLGEDIHTDIGKGMADALVAYRYAAGIRRIENLKNNGKLILVRDADMTSVQIPGRTDRRPHGALEPVSCPVPDLRAFSPSDERGAAYLRDLLYLKRDAVIIEKRRAAVELFGFYVEEEILKLLGLR